MSATTPTPAPARFAPSLAKRNLRFLLALAPAVLAMSLATPGLSLRLLLAAAAALVLDAGCLRLRGLAIANHLAEGGALRAALVLALWLPGAPWWLLLASLALALLLARHALGGLGATPLHAAMAGAAVAQGLFGATPPMPDAGGQWTALALFAGGLGLLASRMLDWRAPLALLAAALLAAAAVGARGLALATGAPWLLVAFFVLAEPGTIGESTRTRAVVAALAGALAVLAAGGASPRALPFALLAASLLAAALDAHVPVRRPREATP